MLNWLNDAVFYEIYPTSFYDSNGDGIGDLKGIEQKADYLKELGVTAVWLNPIYKSPFKDGGYDVSDYYQVDKRFGTNDDLVSLIKALKNRGIKILLDLVIGHTSDKHPWFKKSAQARKNAYYDYYVWTDNVGTEYPGVIRGLYKRNGGYLPNYYASQPALNFGFENPDKNQPWQLHYKDERLTPLRNEIINIMRHYFDLGVDGFRVDMAGSLIKGGATFSTDDVCNDSAEGLKGIKWLWNEILGTLRREYPDKAYLAEWVMPQRSIGMCGFDMDFLHHDCIAFNTLYRNEKGCNLDDSPYFVRGYNYFSEEGKGSLADFVNHVNYLYSRVGDKGMFTAPTGTHDEVRMPTNKSPDMIKCIFAFMLTFKQIPLIYYGDEVGIEHNFKLSKDGGGTRTGARTPMQWEESSPSRGFSNVKHTYLPVGKKAGRSVEAQSGVKGSVLETVRELIKIRKSYPALGASAEQRFIETSYPAVYERKTAGQTITVLINPSNKVVERTVDFNKEILTQNAKISGKKITLNAQSFAILLK